MHCVDQAEDGLATPQMGFRSVRVALLAPKTRCTVCPGFLQEQVGRRSDEPCTHWARGQQQTRKPLLLLLLFDGLLLLRFAERQLFALLFQLPPR